MMSDFSEKVKSANRGVSRWARRTGSVVTQWWEEVNTVQERRSRMRRLARERRQLLTDMGSKVYTLHRKGKVQNRDLLADCGKIDQIGEDIERLEEEIAEIKRARAAAPREVEVEDEAPIVADEDADVSAGEVEEAPAEEPEEAPAEEPEEDAAEEPEEDAAKEPEEDAPTPAEAEDEAPSFAAPAEDAGDEAGEPAPPTPPSFG